MSRNVADSRAKIRIGKISHPRKIMYSALGCDAQASVPLSHRKSRFYCDISIQRHGQLENVKDGNSSLLFKSASLKSYVSSAMVFLKIECGCCRVKERQ